MKAILILLLGLALVQKASANEAYEEFREDLVVYVRTFKQLPATDNPALNVQRVRKAGFDLQQSWLSVKPYVLEANPQLYEYLDPRVNFLVLATYMVQYDPELDKNIPLGSSSYTDAWKQGFAEVYKQTTKSYITELTQRLNAKYPGVTFKFNNGLPYSTHVMFMADAISVTMLEVSQAMAGQPVLQEKINAILKPGK
jgi:hypothetical protein